MFMPPLPAPVHTKLPSGGRRTLLLSDQAAKIVVGRGGMNINQITQRSGCRIQVTRGYPFTQFNIYGTGNFEAVDIMICELLAGQGALRLVPEEIRATFERHMGRKIWYILGVPLAVLEQSY